MFVVIGIHCFISSDTKYLFPSENADSYVTKLSYKGDILLKCGMNLANTRDMENVAKNEKKDVTEKSNLK